MIADSGAWPMGEQWPGEAARLGRVLCFARLRALWTQQQLAHALSISPSQVSRLETGSLPERSGRDLLARATAAVAARRASRRAAALARQEARARLWRTEAEMLGLVLRRQRLLAKWNQRRLAAALGVTQPTIARLERGRGVSEDNGRPWYAEALALTAAALSARYPSPGQPLTQDGADDERDDGRTPWYRVAVPLDAPAMAF